MNKKLKTIRLIKKQIEDFQIPSVTEISFKNDPYLVLISCILSLRTKDKTTIAASRRLFAAANTPRAMLGLSPGRIQKLIYPVGFYRNKSKVILGISGKILTEYAGRVPDTIDELLKLKGVGRKTANLVLGLGWGKSAICVDTHVHRISNRLGWVNTKDPYHTEEELARIIPRKYWIILNTILVAFGQNICVPVSPFCSKCYVKKFCPRIGVKISR
ncbi:MAG: endonuclease III [Candidatus Omnitrophica bacterium]|nr:endonuclease III [Candidatus Omnitrophota bacterium]